MTKQIIYIYKEHFMYQKLLFFSAFALIKTEEPRSDFVFRILNIKLFWTVKKL